MAEGETTQRLAAILAADVAGYTRLMHGDEAATIAALDDCRAVFRTHVEGNRGRIVDMAGDSVLAVFETATGVIRAATAIQDELARFNDAVAEDRRMLFRIGAHLGDIMEKADGTVYGDGVNVAARMESLAAPGGITVSGTVYDSIEGKLNLGFAYLGEKDVKNVDNPVRAYRVGADATPAPPVRGGGRLVALATAAAIAIAAVAGVVIWRQGAVEDTVEAPATQADAPALPDKPSIAVLPFDNLSDDQAQAYFADGMTDDLITDLSKVPDLFVIARNSTFTYKGKPTKVQDVAADLGVRYVLEGSVRRAGDNLRINAQLIDAVDGSHVWAERYDGDFSGVFEFQDKVIAQIVQNLAAHLVDTGPDALAGVDTVVPEAYDAYLQGRELLRKRTNADSFAAMPYFEKAIALDPDYGQAYAALAAAHWNIVTLSWSSAISNEWQQAFDAALANLDKALEHPTPEAYALSADMLARQGHPEQVITNIDKAIALAPSNADFHVTRARVLNLLGRAEEAEASVRTAMKHDPHYVPDFLRMLAISLFHQRRYDEAVDLIKRVIDLQPKGAVDDYTTLLAAYGHLGRTDDAAAVRAELDRLTDLNEAPRATVQYAGFWWYGILYDYDDGYRTHLLDGLRKTGLDDGAGQPERYAEYKALISSPEGDYDVAGAVKIDAAAAKVMRDRGVPFIDVRAPAGFAVGHVPGSLNLELSSEFSEAALAAIAGKDDEVAFSCWGKYCPFAAFAAAKALTWGWTKVFYFAGGFPAWQDAGYEAEQSVGY